MASEEIYGIFRPKNLAKYFLPLENSLEFWKILRNYSKKRIRKNWKINQGGKRIDKVFSKYYTHFVVKIRILSLKAANERQESLVILTMQVFFLVK